MLREVIVGLLARNPDLEPRDVLVMCPDIETFAPLISATFGPTDEDEGAAHPVHPGRRLRVRLADRALRQANPLLAVAARLLELAEARLTTAQVLDLVAMPPVRHRFRFDENDLERLRDLVAHSGIRWGLDPEHRSRFGLGSIRPNTWAAGLDRLLLGVAMAEDGSGWLGTGLPVDDVDSSDVDLVGRLAEAVDRLAATLTALAGEHALSDWLDAIGSGLESLTDVSDADAWQRSQVRAELADVAAAANAGTGLNRQLSISDIRAVLGERLVGRPTRANFRTGDLTMCTMVPMRSVPHRVMCVLGLDDGVFPRGGDTDGDDVLARDPCAGERDVRSEDRQLLLDAVMSASDTLVLVYSGADERTNASRPSAVPLEELLDTIDATVRTADGAAARTQIVVHHPLQPFSRPQLHRRRPRRARPVQLRSSRAGRSGRRRRSTPRRTAIPVHPAARPLGESAIDMEELRVFIEHPVRAFLRQRLGVGTVTAGEDPADGLPVQLNGLESWAVGDRLLRFRLAGVDTGSVRAGGVAAGSGAARNVGRTALTRVDRRGRTARRISRPADGR